MVSVLQWTEEEIHSVAVMQWGSNKLCAMVSIRRSTTWLRYLVASPYHLTRGTRHIQMVPVRSHPLGDNSNKRVFFNPYHRGRKQCPSDNMCLLNNTPSTATRYNVSPSLFYSSTSMPSTASLPMNSSKLFTPQQLPKIIHTIVALKRICSHPNVSE